ncbi:MAG: glycosyl transferase [Rhodobacteraceae bacterium]|nr:glycosyl transferase [Paracoccaceae bacterium]
MDQPPISVVVVSRGRPASLSLCLTGLARLYYRNHEVIVVADAAGLSAARALPFARHLKLIPYEVANISGARNLGISASAGEIVAFIDDDAVPEPTWLTHLAEAFSDSKVGAAGGFVIGRNGISWQWKARALNTGGQASALNVDESVTTVLHPSAGRAVKTEGTNMAVRRWVLKKLGGFDENFRFYMDETDLNMRLAQLGIATAIVPSAIVHHAYAPSARRRQDRAVLDLSDIGRSSALFWRKHALHQDRGRFRTDLETELRKRVLRQMTAGLLEPGAARAALKSLQTGLTEGAVALQVPPTHIARRPDDFLRFPSLATGKAITLCSGRLGRRKMMQQARDLAAQGHTVSAYSLTKTAVFHTVKFLPDGYWLQTGGQFGRSNRGTALFRLISRKSRLRQERNRVRKWREIA